MSGERDSVVDGTEVSVFCAKIDSAEGYVNEFVSFLGTNYDFSLGIAAKRKRISRGVTDGERFEFVLIRCRFSNFKLTNGQRASKELVAVKVRIPGVI